MEAHPGRMAEISGRPSGAAARLDHRLKRGAVNLGRIRESADPARGRIEAAQALRRFSELTLPNGRGSPCRQTPAHTGGRFPRIIMSSSRQKPSRHGSRPLVAGRCEWMWLNVRAPLFQRLTSLFKAPRSLLSGQKFPILDRCAAAQAVEVTRHSPKFAPILGSETAQNSLFFVSGDAGRGLTSLAASGTSSCSSRSCATGAISIR